MGGFSRGVGWGSSRTSEAQAGLQLAWSVSGLHIWTDGLHPLQGPGGPCIRLTANVPSGQRWQLGSSRPGPFPVCDWGRGLPLLCAPSPSFSGFCTLG